MQIEQIKAVDVALRKVENAVTELRTGLSALVRSEVRQRCPKAHAVFYPGMICVIRDVEKDSIIGGGSNEFWAWIDALEKLFK